MSAEWFYATFIEMWTHTFMVRGFAVTVLAASVCALLSCWLVLVGWSLMGDALSHAVVPGIVIAYILGFPFSIGAFIAALICVGLIAVLRNGSGLKEDTVMGVVFTTMLALGLVLISVFPSQIHLQHVIFGDLLGITQSDLLQVVILAPLAAVIVILKRRDLTLFAFDPIHASAIGLSTRRLSALLLTCLAMTVVVAMQAVGAILIVALLIIPGAIAFLMTSSFKRMLWIAPLMSALSVTIGIYSSYWYNMASGAAVVLVHGIVFSIVYVFSPRGLDILHRISNLMLARSTRS
ncbi:metal ABC transporter permease [Arcanobacterium phocisimile]|uniref:Metal ABC transporter permease n=1 Tax=Arcanobacterium phocisimile TaxID=1302235 RepID=A0ABX7IFV9_9ACTO|nr:metal ABC transporter permease [Arcanobacterium phocisimile]QRV01635.1 metal ABC transporter permease [Arcanobacterium phocisimile]